MWMTWFVTTVYYILTSLMGLAYFLYTVSIVYTEKKDLKKVIGCGIIPALVYTLLVLINPLIKGLFDMNMTQGYTRGSRVASTYIVFYAYCIASIVVTVLNHERIDRYIYRILAAFPILAVLVIVVQQIYPNGNLSGLAATCALLIIYLHLQNKQISMDYLTNMPNRKELLNMLGLMLKKHRIRSLLFWLYLFGISSGSTIPAGSRKGTNLRSYSIKVMKSRSNNEFPGYSSV